MKDLTKNLVLKRDKGCIICNSSEKREKVGETGHDGGEISDVHNATDFFTTPPEPNGLHLHHEYKTYGNLAAGVPLQTWKREDIPQKCVILCPSCHAKRTEDRGWITRDIRLHLMKEYPDYQYDGGNP